jgi:uncharacterized SAM-binding protein YcdF (DUF218 family)
MHIYIVLLGSNVLSILLDRIFHGILFAEQNHNITWFLTGGKKHIDSINESDIMLEELHKRMAFTYNPPNWTFVVDSDSTNTVENIFRLSDLILPNTEYYIVTSQFHFKRAEKIVSKIISSHTFYWILSSVTPDDAEYWENIHINNVDLDILNFYNKKIK